MQIANSGHHAYIVPDARGGAGTARAVVTNSPRRIMNAMHRTPRRYGLAIAACWLCVHAGGVAAQPADAARNFPSKPIRMIVPFPPGGSNDILGRFIAQKMTEQMGQQTIVDNRAGADGVIGSEMAARAVPDGHTLLIGSTTFTMNPAIHKLPYDTVKAFTPVALIASGANVLAITPSLPINSLKELIALAKSKPGQVRYASSGIGG